MASHGRKVVAVVLKGRARVMVVLDARRVVALVSGQAVVVPVGHRAGAAADAAPNRAGASATATRAADAVPSKVVDSATATKAADVVPSRVDAAWLPQWRLRRACQPVPVVRLSSRRR